MTLEEYARLDAVGLAHAVARGEVTSAEAAALARAAAARVNGVLNAVVEIYGDEPDAVGPGEGPLAGVPLLYKDAGAAEEGRLQELGSRLAVGRVAPVTSELARRFRAAGLTPVGRSASPEFSLSLSTESALRGPTRNPWDPGRSAGGSSGGAAAAVAAGVVPVAHATDAAGSIRIPASLCGLVGLKPSRGRIGHGPAAGEPLMGMDTEFALTRSVRDAATLLTALSGAAPGDPVVAPPFDRGQRDALAALAAGREAPPGRLRVAWTVDAWGGYPVDPGVAAATRDLAEELAATGHHVEAASPTFDYDAFVEAAGVGWALGFDVLVDEIAAERGRPVDASTLETVTLRLVEEARELRGADVARAESELNAVRRGVAAFFGRFDVLLTPTLARPPEPLGVYRQDAPHPNFASFFRHCDRSGAFLPLFNATGQPALSLPLAWTPDGLPIGMQLVGRYGEEVRLLELAAELERARPWRDRRPRVHAASPEEDDGTEPP